MDSFRNRNILTIGMLILISLSLFFIPAVYGKTNDISDHNIGINGTGNYFEDFSTTTYYDGSSTASGWGNGAVTKDRNFSVSILDYFQTDDPVRGVAVQGRKAYFVEYNQTSTLTNFQALNINDPSDIQHMSSRSSVGVDLLTIEVEGDVGYIGIGGSNDRINVYNISDPFNLGAPLNYLDVAVCDGAVTDISIQGSLLYYTAFNDTSDRSFRVVNVEDPDIVVEIIPDWVSNKDLGLDVAGHFTYLAASTEGLYILNTSNVFAPVEVGHIDTPGNATDVLVDGGFAYIADGAAGIHVVDIRNPTNPTILGTYNTPGSALKMQLQGRTLFVADGTGGVQVLDVADKSNPCFVTSISPSSYTWDLDLFGGDLVVAADDGIYTMRLCAGTGIGNIAEEVYSNTFDQYNALDVRVQGDIAYVAGGTNGFYTVNVRDPSNPILLDQINVTGYARKLEVDGQFAYVIDYGYAFRVYDISDPTNIVETDSIGLTYPTDVAISGEIAWIADGPYGVYYYNVSNPYSLSYVGSFDDGFDNVTSIWVQGPHLYLTEYRGSGSSDCVHIYDIQDFSDPKLTDTRFRYDYNYDIQVDGDVLYLAGTSFGNGAWLYNTSDPFSMSIFSNVNRDTHGVWSFGQYLLTADMGDGVALVDTTSLLSISAQSIYPDATAALQITTHGDYTYIANTTNMIILRHYKSAGDTYRTSVSTAQSLEIDTATKGEFLTATLDVDDYVPSGTTVEYFMSPDGGTHWEVVTPGAEHTFTNEGIELLWKADIVGPEDRSVHIYSVSIDYEHTDGFDPTSPLWLGIFIGGGALVLIIITVVIVVAVKKGKKTPTR